tara:strand:- start:1283 stop:1471 length:189 start_codon:yes stop_codon:yes gene_type:complete
MVFEQKTIEELHEMTLSELRTYINDAFSHISEATAIRDYRAKIGEPKLLAQPVEVEFQEEEE